MVIFQFCRRFNSLFAAMVLLIRAPFAPFPATTSKASSAPRAKTQPALRSGFSTPLLLPIIIIP